MTEFLNALVNPDVPFIRYALFAGLLSSIPFGIIGSLVVVKRMTYIAGALSHTALGGIGLSLFLTTVFNVTLITPMTGALLFALAAGIIISITITRNTERVDTIIGTIWAVGMSIGLIFMYLSPGYTDPMSYLFGNILLVSSRNLILVAFLDFIICTISLGFFHQFIAVSFDADFARTRGLKIDIFETLLILTIALTVILMITIIGIVMVIALLTIPPAIAGFFTRRMKSMMIVSSFTCAIITTGGLISSYILALPTGSTTVLLGGILYVIAKGVSRKTK